MTIPTPVRLHVGVVVHPTDGPRIRWIAPQVDGVAHAYPPGKLEKAACGAMPVDERFAYGKRIRHHDCLVIVEAERIRLGSSEITESERRLEDGNR